MILRPEIQPTDPQSVLSYYLANYAEVHAVTCDSCGEDLAVEIKGPVEKLQPNELGLVVIAIGSKLLASRTRLDGMMGYQCACGNDTRACQIEEDCSPSGGFAPHEVAQVLQTMADEDWRAPVEQVGDTEIRDSFSVERIK